MNLNGKLLDEWFDKHRTRLNNFPGQSDYCARYRMITDWLVKHIHPEVNRAALSIDNGYLTDHGPMHIEKVINKASYLVMADKCQLSPYETYILLVAIQLHDVGNIFGRLGHEARIGEVVREMGTVCGDDSVEKKRIVEIAQAHGGEVGGDKDKIGFLPPEEPILGKTVRLQLLAAILKFADELAEDSDRAARFLLKKGRIPKANEVYHKYAQHLHSVMVDTKGREIKMSFGIPLKDVKTKFGKDKRRTVYLLDEIFARTVKTHTERTYCARFLRAHHIDIDAITVKIEIFNEDDFAETVETIGYRLVERGYPDGPADGVYDLCPELNDWKKVGRLDIGRLDGKSLDNCLALGAEEA